MNKINCILARATIQDHLEPEQFHWGCKSPNQVPWSSSVHSLLSELSAVWEEGKDSISEELFPCYLLHFPSCKTSANSFAFTLQRESNGDFHRSSLCRISFPAERHWINPSSSRFVQNSVLLGAGAWHEGKERGVAACASSGVWLQ